MCCFQGFFLENLLEFEGRFLSDLCVNKMVHASRQNNYLLGNNKSLKKTPLKTLLSLPTVVSGNHSIFEGFHRKSQISRVFDTLEQHLLIFAGFRYPRTAPSYFRGFSRVCTNPENMPKRAPLLNYTQITLM